MTFPQNGLNEIQVHTVYPNRMLNCWMAKSATLQRTNIVCLEMLKTESLKKSSGKAKRQKLRSVEHLFALLVSFFIRPILVADHEAAS